MLQDSLKDFPAIKDGYFEADISISSPVFGLRPFLASRLFNLKVPKPTIATRLPAETSYKSQVRRP
jgi:hypothetical protein